MNLAYSVRLVCLCLASFFIVNLAAGLFAAAIAKPARRFAMRLKSRSGAALMLALRLAPMVLALCVVIGLCVPSYLWMEPEAISEPVGGLCLFVAALAALNWLLAASRTARAVARSRRYLRLNPTREYRQQLAGEWLPVHVVRGREPLFALAGVFRTRLIVSQRALAEFPDEELASALRHERAHADSRDNLKRMMILLTPDVLPCLNILRSLERAWARLAEWSADDRASAGSTRRSIALASALVRAARFTASLEPPPHLVTALLADGDDLAVRVDRLLGVVPAPVVPMKPAAYLGGAFLLTAAVASAMLNPSTLALAHELLEELLH